MPVSRSPGRGHPPTRGPARAPVGLFPGRARARVRRARARGSRHISRTESSGHARSSGCGALTHASRSLWDVCAHGLFFRVYTHVAHRDMSPHRESRNHTPKTYRVRLRLRECATTGASVRRRRAGGHVGGLVGRRPRAPEPCVQDTASACEARGTCSTHEQHAELRALSVSRTSLTTLARCGFASAAARASTFNSTRDSLTPMRVEMSRVSDVSVRRVRSRWARAMLWSYKQCSAQLFERATHSALPHGTLD